MNGIKKIACITSLLIIFNSSYAQNAISKAKAFEDIDYYNNILNEVHVNPYRNINKKDYLLKVEDLKNSIKDSISINDFIILLYNMSAPLQDSHTSPAGSQPVFINDYKKEQFFPYPLVIDNHKLYVPKTSAVALGIPIGAKIISINHVLISHLLPKIETYYGGRSSFSTDVASKFLCYFLFLNHIKPPFKIEYTDDSGDNKSITLPKGLSIKDAIKASMPNNESNYTFKILDNKLGYFNFTSMSGNLDLFGKFVDSCITLVKSKNIQNIAIDVRGNGGGNSQFGDVLLSYLTTKKYSLMGGRKWKVSALYKEYLKSNEDTSHSYLTKPNGSVWELGDCNPKENEFKSNNLFTGNVYLLTGAFTFSSANMFSDGIKHYKLATVVGEPTGENTNDFGEVYAFALPNSKIKMQTTTSFDFGTDCNKNSSSPVLPDKLIERTLHAKIYEEDKALEYILNQIK